MSVDAFLRAFRYRAGSVLSPWRDVSLDDEPQGDCQDFALSVLSLETGGHPWRAILTGRAMIWRAQSPVNGIIPRHAVLWLRGKGWADSTVREWRKTPTPHKLRWPAGAPVLLGLAVAAKMWG